MEAGCQTCHAADMVLVSNDVGWTLSDGKIFSASAAAWAVIVTKAMTRNPEDFALRRAADISKSRQEKKDNSNKRTI